MKVYFFNVTNAEEILRVRNGTKPNLQEVGPYVYRQFTDLRNVTWNDNDTVTYYQNKTYFYQPHLSNGTLGDIITVINPVLLVRFETFVFFLCQYVAILGQTTNTYLTLEI